jgi:DNA-directed RNA polymerase subunit RPC12/RpoP
MLVAHDLEGARVMAWDATRGPEYQCPECGSVVLLKAGQVVTKHFAHRAAETCGYGEGESYQHEFMKYQFTRWWPDVELEVAGIAHGRRADAVVRHPDGDFVVECQASAISVEEWMERTNDYAGAHVRLLWVWYSTLLTEHHPPTEYRVPASAGRSATLRKDRLIVFRWPGALELWDLVTPRRDTSYVRQVHKAEVGDEYDAPRLPELWRLLNRPRRYVAGPGTEVALNPVSDAGHRVFRICDTDGDSMGVGLFESGDAAIAMCKEKQWQLAERMLSAE